MFIKILRVGFQVVLLICFLYAYYRGDLNATVFFGFVYLMDMVQEHDNDLKEKIESLRGEISRCQRK